MKTKKPRSIKVGDLVEVVGNSALDTPKDAIGMQFRVTGLDMGMVWKDGKYWFMGKELRVVERVEDAN